MMVHCEWLVLCQRVILDMETGNLTLVGCYERIQAAGFPATHPGFAFAARYVRDEDAPDTAVAFRFVRLSEHDPEEVVAELDGTWTADAPVVRVYLNFNHLRLVRAETLRFRIDHRLEGEDDWTPGQTTRMDITQMGLSEEARNELVSHLEATGQDVPDVLK